MAEGKVLTGAGLRGQVAGKTALSTRRQKRGRFNLPWL